MKKALIGLLAAFGGLVLVCLVALILIGFAVRRGTASVPQKTVLEVNLETGLAEYVPGEDALAQVLMKDKPTLRDTVDAIDRAASDDRVAGMVATMGNAGLGWAQIQEVRDAVKRFRAKKKFAIAYAETFGEFSSGNGAYYLATAFDKIYMQPTGDLNLTGIMLESQFFAGAIEKLGMKFQGDHRYDYKTALNQYTEKKMTPAHRESYAKLMNSWYGQLTSGIAEGRKIKQEEVTATIDKGPFLGHEAVDAKLVDAMKYRDEVFDEAKKMAGNNAELLYSSKYLERAGRPNQKGKQIALVYAVGPVLRGKDGVDPIFGGQRMGSTSVSAHLREAAGDKNVKAIVLRVDSPGGSAVASETIRREVMRARQKGKPVIISMGNLAASGGYWISMNADKIVAQPGTITASIGVLGGKMVTTGLMDKIGVSFDAVQAGANADIYSTHREFSPQEWQRLQAWLDRIYGEFTTNVAEGRKLPKDKVLEIAKGRVWTGEDAKALGLVDELGGVDVAVKLAKQAAKIGDGEEVYLRRFPGKKSLYQILTAEGPENSERVAEQVMVRTLQAIQPLAQQLRAITGETSYGPVTMPEMRPAQ